MVNFVFATLAVLLLNWAGRKKLLVGGSVDMVAALAALGWYFSTSTSFQHHNALIGLGCILAFLAFFELSLGPVFWLMISELYPLRIRSKTMATATMVNWAFNFLRPTSRQGWPVARREVHSHRARVGLGIKHRFTIFG